MADHPLPRLSKQIDKHQKKLVEVLVIRREKITALLLRFSRDPKLAASKAARERMFKRLTEEYDRLQKDIEKWGNGVAKSASKEFFEKAKEDIGSSDIIVATLEEKHAEAYAADLVPLNGPAIAAVHTQKMCGSDIRQLRAGVVETFRVAKVKGFTAVERQKHLHDAILNLVEKGMDSWKFVDKAGKKWNNGNYFNMLNRTTVARVSREAYADALIDNGFDLVTIEGGGDACPACSNWRGVIVSISGADKQFPSLADAEAAGVFHPNCVCGQAYVDKTVHKKEIDSQSNTPNPEKPDKESWNKYAKGINNEKKELVGITAKPAALKVDGKLDKKLKQANT